MSTLINQKETPIFDALKHYVNEQTLPFHVPGHKQGRGNKFCHRFWDTTMAIDLTCMEDLDNICNPKSVIKKPKNWLLKLIMRKMPFPR